MKIQVTPGEDSHSTLVLIDGKPAGCVQEFSWDITANNLFPTVTITVIPDELKIGDTTVFNMKKFLKSRELETKNER